ncbi:hypothetical protein GRJ2_001944200 [Grus japonensis]|uniref:Uncharacterized protein n=1 Tax=Grus japonensis TaxID=30415 RepID=A0ABC9XAX8_GRUJA
MRTVPAGNCRAICQGDIENETRYRLSSVSWVSDNSFTALQSSHEVVTPSCESFHNTSLSSAVAKHHKSTEQLNKAPLNPEQTRDFQKYF